YYWWSQTPKLRGHAHYALKAYAAAAQDYEAAIAAEPAYDFFRLERPYAWETKEELAARIEQARKTAALTPRNRDARRDYALALSANREFEQALAELDAGLGLTTDDLELMGVRALVLWHLDRDEEGDALSAKAVARRRELDQAGGRGPEGVEVMQKY